MIDWAIDWFHYWLGNRLIAYNLTNKTWLWGQFSSLRNGQSKLEWYMARSGTENNCEQTKRTMSTNKLLITLIMFFFFFKLCRSDAFFLCFPFSEQSSCGIVHHNHPLCVPVLCGHLFTYTFSDIAIYLWYFFLCFVVVIVFFLSVMKIKTT